MFAQREGDAVDWYDYVNHGENFDDGSLKMTVVNGAVAAVATDPTMLFPQGATVLEVSGVPTSDAQKEFGGKIYDAEHQTFRAPEPVVHPDPMADLLKRVEALEKGKP